MSELTDLTHKDVFSSTLARESVASGVMWIVILCFNYFMFHVTDSNDLTHSEVSVFTALTTFKRDSKESPHSEVSFFTIGESPPQFKN